MDKGIKPTRLWYYSGRKHIQNWLNDRLTAQPGYDHEQRPQRDMLKLIGLVFTTAFGLAYSYGYFSPEKYLATIIKPNSESKCDLDPKCVPPCPVSKPSPDNKKSNTPCKK